MVLNVAVLNVAILNVAEINVTALKGNKFHSISKFLADLLYCDALWIQVGFIETLSLES